MWAVPNEVLRDVLLPLDRWTLDAVQLTNRRFLQVIMERMSDVCLRQVKVANFGAPKENENKDAFSCIRTNGRPKRKISNAHKDAARLFSEFVQALRSSHVEFFSLHQFVFTPELAALVLQTPIVADHLSIIAGSCNKLSPTQFQEVLVHFAPTSLDI